MTNLKLLITLTSKAYLFIGSKCILTAKGLFHYIFRQVIKIKNYLI